MEAVVELHALLTSRVIAATINGLNVCANSFMYSRLSIQFCPPVVIIVALLYDSMIVTAVAFGLFLLKMGKIQNYLQNKINMIAATVMVSFVISDVMISRSNNQFQIVYDIIVDGTTLTAYIGVAWLLFGYPLGRIFVSDKVEDTVRLAH